MLNCSGCTVSGVTTRGPSCPGEPSISQGQSPLGPGDAALEPTQQVLRQDPTWAPGLGRAWEAGVGRECTHVERGQSPRNQKDKCIREHLCLSAFALGSRDPVR